MGGGASGESWFDKKFLGVGAGKNSNTESGFLARKENRLGFLFTDLRAQRDRLAMASTVMDLNSVLRFVGLR